MHWIWTNERTDEDQATCNTAPAALEDLDDLSFEAGERVTAKVPAITLEMGRGLAGSAHR